MQKIKMFFNKGQIIGELFATLMIILIPIINNNKYVCIGWFFISLTCFFDAVFLKKWGIIGRTWDKKKDNNYKTQLSRDYSDKALKKYSKRCEGYELRQKIYGSLLSKGFNSDDIRKVLSKSENESIMLPG